MDKVELVISANGCIDNTKEYLNSLVIPNIKIIWNDFPLGFAKAINDGIKVASANKIVLLNNDTVLLNQAKNQWLEMLDQGHVSGVLTQYSEITKRNFLIFFCTMIKKEVFNKIGYINENFNTGGCEDIEFCLKAEQAGFDLVDCGNNGTYPIYHRAEGTMNDPSLVQDWGNKFLLNELKLAKQYNFEWYKWRLSNNYERAVFLNGEPIFPREITRYIWANKHLYGNNILEIGCSTGYGSQFLPNNINYLGLDYDPIIISVAKEQDWGYKREFEQADINTYKLGNYDTIIAFEVIEHLDNGLEIVEKLKNHCHRLLITVPHNEPKGFWGEHHKLHGLTEDNFLGFKFSYINEHGKVSETMESVTETNSCNLMLCRWDNA
jgi:SAM-dependent methyltransferase